jgi:hypothetical protein
MSTDGRGLLGELEKLAATLGRRRAFFSTLADQACVDLGARSNDNCWNGRDVGK